MRKILLFTSLYLLSTFTQAQFDPVVTAWLQNTTGTGSYYVQGNSTAINNNILYNCQKVEFSNNGDWVYITTTGIPAYPTGPFLDGNPSQASNQNAIFRFPLNPVEETGTPTVTTPGNIGVFINGVALFDYRDGVAWNTNSNSICGGPGNPPCGPPGTTTYWNRDAVPAEMAGFDCAKGHPAMGNYHHHQNPSAFKWDLSVVSNICDLYDADALYTIDPAQHSPLIGFAYDGFPIYGAYGYKNADGTGGIERIKSGYQLRNITQRTHWADGTNVPDGPNVSATYFLGYFREDYEWVAQTGDDYLDEHNGRFCVTPEYPNGTYAYFATVDSKWNSAYPYVVGPTFYGEYANRSVNSINEATTVYTPPVCATDLFLTGPIASGIYQVSNSIEANGSVGTPDNVVLQANEILLSENFEVSLSGEFLAEIAPCGSFSSSETQALISFYNPLADVIVLQVNGLLRQDVNVRLKDGNDQLVEEVQINQGSTIQYLDTQTLYDGDYWIEIGENDSIKRRKISIIRE